MASRLLVGNLDAEHRLAGETITRAALETASALATLMRVFAREGDRLWTPVPVDPERMPAAPELPRPKLVSGGWEAIEPAPEVLPWAEVAGVAALRSRSRRRREATSLPKASLVFHGRLRVMSPPDAEVVKRVLHRGFHLQVARELGVALPGARRVRSIEELEEHLETGGAEASPTGGWVGKAPWSAAGRSRVIEPCSLPGSVLSPSARRRAERLLARHGELLFEPWMDRVADFGCAGVVTGDGQTDVGSLRSHRSSVDSVGRFQGIEIPGFDDGRHGDRPLHPVEARDGSRDNPLRVGATIDEMAARVADALRAAGYRGPFGIDAYLHRDREGREVLQPLGEINARLTFGHVARALGERLAGGRAVRLEVSRRPPPHDREVLPLLLPDDDGSPGAWLAIL